MSKLQNTNRAKGTAILVFFIICSLPSFSQQDFDSFKQKIRNQYETFHQEVVSSYSNFRQKANAEYAEFMRKSWDHFLVIPEIPQPQSPDPLTPPVKEDPNEIPEDHLVPQGKIEPLLPPKKQPLPIEPIPMSPDIDNGTVLNFKFYNILCSVAWNDSLKIKLNSLNGDSLSLVWNTLSGSAYNDFLSGCIGLRAKLSLCDWGYLEMVKTITKNIFGSSTSNEAVFLQTYVLSQTGYKIRLAQVEKSQLVLLINTDFDIYSHMFLKIDDEKYFLIDSRATEIEVLSCGFSNEQPISLSIDAEQLADNEESQPKLFTSKAFPVETAKIGVNKKLIEFYNSYPHCDWKIYANAPLSETIKKNLYPILKHAIKGKSEAEAANMLINFVQTAFEYKTDEDQFGYERSFFSEEVFFYPYSDCEDRAILFSILIRDLLHLKVVLLHYPNHLATAVHFTEDLQGDFLNVNDEKFLVCDPTYIGAPIGDAMPQFKEIQAEVVIL
jgi:hypothetical protein